MKTLKTISLKQLNDWLKINKKYTWFVGIGGGFDEGRPLIKYLYPKFDTRTMNIFRIDCDNERFTVDFRDECNIEGNILDLLDQKIKDYLDE